MPSEDATSYFHQGSAIIYPTLDVIGLRMPCRGNIERGRAYDSISRAQNWHQIYLVHELWPLKNSDAKSQYIKRATKQFAYDEDSKACKTRSNEHALSTNSFGAIHIFIISKNKSK
jgi:hypothetical protein